MNVTGDDSCCSLAAHEPCGFKRPRIRGRFGGVNPERVPPPRPMARIASSRPQASEEPPGFIPKPPILGGRKGGEIYQDRLFVSRLGWVWGRLAFIAHGEEM